MHLHDQFVISRSAFTVLATLLWPSEPVVGGHMFCYCFFFFVLYLFSEANAKSLRDCYFLVYANLITLFCVSRNSDGAINGAFCTKIRGDF